MASSPDKVSLSDIENCLKSYRLGDRVYLLTYVHVVYIIYIYGHDGLLSFSVSLRGRLISSTPVLNWSGGSAGDCL
jgi:hypothetical protein